jgi:hypothetical protein
MLTLETCADADARARFAGVFKMSSQTVATAATAAALTTASATLAGEPA